MRQSFLEHLTGQEASYLAKMKESVALHMARIAELEPQLTQSQATVAELTQRVAQLEAENTQAEVMRT